MSDYIYPNFNLFVQDQEFYGYDGWSVGIGCCFASAISLAMEIIVYKHTGVKPFRSRPTFSVMWLYGNRRLRIDDEDTSDDSPWDDTIMRCWKFDGIALWSDLPGCWFYYSKFDYTGSGMPTAKQSVDEIYYALQTKARKYSINDFRYYWTPSTSTVKDEIYKNGCTLMTFEKSGAIEKASGDGIVPDSSYGVDDGHVMVCRGWKQINGNDYWICQNSWGKYWGDNGLCYVPFEHPDIEGIIKVEVPSNLCSDDYSKISKFYWDTAKISGDKFNLTASEWNRFRKKVINMCKISNAELPKFNNVYKGQVFTYNIFNETILYLDRIFMSSWINNVYKGDKVKAEDIERLDFILNLDIDHFNEKR